MNSFRFPLFLFSLILLLYTPWKSANAQIPRVISYQGVAMNGSGGVLSSGNHNFTMRLYDTPDGITPIYEQTTTEVVIDGLFSVLIGPIPESLKFDRPYYLGVAIDGGGELEVRTSLTTSPYAFNSLRADTALYVRGFSPDTTSVVTRLNGLSGSLNLRGSGGTRVSIDGSTLIITSDTTAGGSTKNAWSLSGNAKTKPGTEFLGTIDEEAMEIHVDDEGYHKAVSSGRGRVVRYEPNDDSPNILAGFHGNKKNGEVNGVVIAGGGAIGESNVVSNSYATIGGGKGNIVSGVNGTVAGGIANQATAQSATVGGGSGNISASIASTVGGGLRNQAKNWNSTVSGGKENVAESVSSTISGGEQNSATGIATTISGGAGHRVFGDYGTIGGGDGNSTSEEYPTVGGGRFNNASGDAAVVAGGSRDTAAGNYSAVGGGLVNKASGLYSAITGGEANKASGRSSAIGGGTLNSVPGDFSVVPGGFGLTIEGDQSFGFYAGNPAQNKTMILAASNVALFGNTDVFIGNNDGKPRALRFYEPHSENGIFPGLNTHYTSFKAGEQNQYIEYTLPLAPGAIGDVLSISAITGNGREIALEWVTPSTPGSVATSEQARLLQELKQKTEELEKTQELLRQAILELQRAER